ncbi:thiamine pyrophosphokinase [Xylariomycetidae sp. FL2044]|nr:thiamine pyrophosphokinase [Xylariomycetidae sp. FL2044]
MASEAEPELDPHVVDWHPIRLFLNCPDYQTYQFALIVLNQPIPDEALFRHLWSIAKVRVAADGGANQIYNLARASSPSGKGDTNGPHYTNLDAIIGDLDSLTDEARSFFTTHHPACQVIHDPDQYSTDYSKAVRHVRARRPGMDIVAVGGLGGRVDQGLSQLHHLYLFQTSPTYQQGKMLFLSGESVSFLLKGSDSLSAGEQKEKKEKKKIIHKIRVRGPPPDAEAVEAVAADLAKKTGGEPFDKYVGIVPIKEPSVITTRGLEWDVEDWPTEFGGNMSTSNHVLPDTQVVEVETTKDVVFTIALKPRPK